MTLLAIAITACSPTIVSPIFSTSTPKPLVTITEPAPNTDLNTPRPLQTETVRCIETLVAPVINEVKPEKVTPGSEIEINGTGGYIQDTCGGYNESARTFKVFLDQKPAIDLICYINHCIGKVTLAPDISPGFHCLSMKPGGCERKLEIEN